MLKPGRMATYMRRDIWKTSQRAQGMPREIEITTIYDKIFCGGCWDSIVWDASRTIKTGYGGQFHPMMDQHTTKTGGQEQHQNLVECYKRLGYEIIEHHDDCQSWYERLEDNPELDLLGSSQKQWNQWEFLRYLKREGKI